MTQAPPERRDIFVERALDPDTNTQRLATVRDYATKVTIDGRLAAGAGNAIWCPKADRPPWSMRPTSIS